MWSKASSESRSVCLNISRHFRQSWLMLRILSGCLRTLQTFCFYLVVEEILVCFDRPQSKILQGLNCRGGELISSLFHLVVLVIHFPSMSSVCVSSGL